MNLQTLKQHYREQKRAIVQRLVDFKQLSPEKQLHEFLFCTLTPQSNAVRCWAAVKEIVRLQKISKKQLIPILRTRTRFHNNKAKYIIHNLKNWHIIQHNLENTNRVSLRNWLADNVKGYGLKEAGHFLRNIGKSDNQVAILDRHILRNLAKLKVINKNDLVIKNQKHYLALEKKFLLFSDKVSIPLDHLDLVFWSYETGEIFK